jgi:hypothetical protein
MRVWQSSLCALGFVILLASSSRAQSFNIDFARYAGGGLPSNSYGAGAGQAGFWTNVDYLFYWAVPAILDDVNGATTNVELHTAGNLQPMGNAATSGDDERLLDDGVVFPFPLDFVGLAAGDYDVYTYAWSPSFITNVRVSGSPDPQQGVGGANWSGAHVQGVTYARHHVCGLPAGGAINVPFSPAAVYSVCNGVQLVHTPPAGVSCAPVGPTASGCTPTISASANPKLDHSNACSVTVANVDAQRNGIVFYGISGSLQLPWCAGGNSFLCVKSPTQRTPLATSRGTAGLCNGAFVLNWNAYQLAHPGALGNPWSACDRAWIQAWFRDPGSCKSTFLSPMVELVYVP